MIFLGSDHAGYECKTHVKNYLTHLVKSFYDCGTFSEHRVDFPSYANEVCSAVLERSKNIGILVCGTGQGMAMAANRHKGIRAALCSTPEIAALSRLHNNANVLVLAGRGYDAKNIESIVDAFLNTSFSSDERYRARLLQIDV